MNKQLKPKKPSISVVIPIFNEEKILQSVITDLINILRKQKNRYEIIAVNDGSVDNSQKKLQSLSKKHKKVKIISHELNKGYGAALKTGIKTAKFDFIMIIDADGTYSSKEIPKLLKLIPAYQTVTGARLKKGAKIPLTRWFGKKIIQLLITLLTGIKTPDFNSGFRIFRKDIIQEFWHLFPDKFSFTTTLTLITHLKKYSAKYVSINYGKRVGQSSLKSYNFFYFLILIIQLVVYFSPLKFFFWPGIICGTIGTSWIFFTIIKYQNITDAGLLLLLTGIQIAFFGLIADLIVKNRENPNK